MIRGTVLENFVVFDKRLVDITSIGYFSPVLYEKTFAGLSEVSYAYQINIVLSGEVLFSVNGKALILKKHDALLISPNCVVTNGANGTEAEVFTIYFRSRKKPFDGDFALAHLGSYQVKAAEHFRYVAENSRPTNERIDALIRSSLETLVMMICAGHDESGTIGYFAASAETFHKIFAYLENNICRAPRESVIASENGMSVSNLRKVVQMYTGMRTSLYIKKIRIRNVIRSACGNKTLKEACAECGFCSESYFCKLFKKETGMTFKEYKREISNERNL